MGAWGTAVFSDDTACNVRDDYMELVGDGLSGPDATKALLPMWSASLNDADEAPVFWLALAATQWKCGRLEPDVLQQALNVIDGGTDLDRWVENKADHRTRQAVLAKLRKQLVSPQRPEKQILKRFRDSNEWGVGDLITYRLLSGRFVIWRVIGHNTDKGGTAPVCELLDWVGEELPGKLQLPFLDIKKSNAPRPITQWMIGRAKAKERPDDRLRLLGINQKPTQTPGQFTVTLWRWLDQTLKEEFSLQ
jgi:hypothetical protein